MLGVAVFYQILSIFSHRYSCMDDVSGSNKGNIELQWFEVDSYTERSIMNLEGWSLQV